MQIAHSFSLAERMILYLHLCVCVEVHLCMFVFVCVCLYVFIQCEIITFISKFMFMTFRTFLSG